MDSDLPSFLLLSAFSRTRELFEKDVNSGKMHSMNFDIRAASILELAIDAARRQEYTYYIFQSFLYTNAFVYHVLVKGCLLRELHL